MQSSAKLQCTINSIFNFHMSNKKALTNPLISWIPNRSLLTWVFNQFKYSKRKPRNFVSYDELLIWNDLENIKNSNRGFQVTEVFKHPNGLTTPIMNETFHEKKCFLYREEYETTWQSITNICLLSFRNCNPRSTSTLVATTSQYGNINSLLKFNRKIRQK